MTATELDGPMQKPLGSSKLGSSVCDRLLLLIFMGKILAPLKFEVYLELGFKCKLSPV